MNAPEEPQPLSYVFERMVILRTAHKLLAEMGHTTPEVPDLLDTAAWLAGDAVPGEAENLLTAPEEAELEDDGTGA
jgi:hypothetical protein